MPLVWNFPVPDDQKAAPPQTQEVHATAPSERINLVDDTAFYDEGVIAKYDVEILTAQHLELHNRERYGMARGSVHLIDPDGTMDADDLTFSWDPVKRYIIASNVLVKIAGAVIRARHADLRAGRWTLTDFYFTTDRLRPPLYSLQGSSIVIYPGHDAKIKSPELSIFGQHVYGLPSETINLDPRATGLRPPNLEYRREAGFGINWVSGVLLDKSSTLEFHADSYPGSRPGDGAVVTRSFANPDLAQRLIAPRSEFSQRFDFGFFENVLVADPLSENHYLSEPRNSISVESSQNNGVSGRGTPDEDFSLPVAIEYERGGNIIGFPMLNDVRLENIESVGDHDVTRLVSASSVDLPSIRFARNLLLISRVDGSLFFSGSAFGWVRATSGLVYSPLRWLHFSAGATGGIESGTPDFDIDPLHTVNGYTLRADYHLGPRKFGVMTRYDTKLGWYDREYTFTQAMGSLEAYFIYRQYPEDYRYGITLRLDQFENLLKRRTFRRPAAGETGGFEDTP